MSSEHANGQVEFSRLTNELARRRKERPERAENYTRIVAAASKLSKTPLVHGSERREVLTELVRTRAALYSRIARDLEPNDAEKCLGIHDKAYASMGVLYPDKSVALLFHEQLETPETDASPWDSGAFNRKLETDGFSPDERRALFHEYVLKAPWHRRYLVDYVASCFWDAMHYLDVTQRHAFSDPLGMLDTMLPRLRSFEVRVPTRLPIDSDTLLAVFLRQGKKPLSTALASWLENLQQAGVKIEIDRSRKTRRFLHSKVRQWIREYVSAT